MASTKCFETWTIEKSIAVQQNALRSPRQGLLESLQAQPQQAHHRRFRDFLFFFWLWKICRCAVWNRLQQGGAQPYANTSCRCQHGAEGCQEKMLAASGRYGFFCPCFCTCSHAVNSSLCCALLLCVGIAANHLNLMLLWQH